MTDLQPELPGLEPPSQRPDANTLETAAHSLIAKLRADGLLDDSHVLIVQIIIDLARAVGISAQQGKAAGMAMAAKELREYMLLLPKANDDDWSRLVAELNSSDSDSNVSRETLGTDGN